MKKILSLCFMAVLISFTNIAFAKVFDFTGVKVVAPPNINWSQYKDWMFGWGQKDLGLVSDADRIERFAKGTMIYNMSSPEAVQITYLGVTNDYPDSFPNPAPLSCQVTVANNDVLYVYGTIYVPPNGGAPYVENLQCRLKVVP